MNHLTLTASDLAELGHFMHINFRGPERDLLLKWLNMKLEAVRAKADSEPEKLSNREARAA